MGRNGGELRSPGPDPLPCVRAEHGKLWPMRSSGPAGHPGPLPAPSCCRALQTVALGCFDSLLTQICGNAKLDKYKVGL